MASMFDSIGTKNRKQKKINKIDAKQKEQAKENRVGIADIKAELQGAIGQEIGIPEAEKRELFRGFTQGLLDAINAAPTLADVDASKLDIQLHETAKCYKKSLEKGDTDSAEFSQEILEKGLSMRYDFAPSEIGREQEVLNERAEYIASAVSAMKVSSKCFEDKFHLEEDKTHLDHLKVQLEEYNSAVENMVKDHFDLQKELDEYSAGDRRFDTLSPEAHALALKKAELIRKYNESIGFAYRTIFLEADISANESMVNTVRAMWRSRLATVSKEDQENLRKEVERNQDYIKGLRDEMLEMDGLMEAYANAATDAANDEEYMETVLRTERKYDKLKRDMAKREKIRSEGAPMTHENEPEIQMN